MEETNIDADVIVVGGGASGLMAAGRAAELGARVILLEKTDGIGKKILVSGKTRCNLTNSADLKKYISMYGPNGRFLRSAFHRFFRPELIAFCERYNLKTKTERGGRIFPLSDNARDVVNVFKKYLSENNARIMLCSPVDEIVQDEKRIFRVKTSGQNYFSRCVILAAGGSSWPETGSSGDGCVLASRRGHSIVELRPALVPLIVHEQNLARSMQGVSLRNVRATVFRGRAEDSKLQLMPNTNYGRGEAKQAKEPVIESRFGEMLFTHFGLGGPIVLLMSLAVVDALSEGPVCVLIDLKPALSLEQLNKRLQKGF